MEQNSSLLTSQKSLGCLKPDKSINTIFSYAPRLFFLSSFFLFMIFLLQLFYFVSCYFFSLVVTNFFLSRFIFLPVFTISLFFLLLHFTLFLSCFVSFLFVYIFSVPLLPLSSVNLYFLFCCLSHSQLFEIHHSFPAVSTSKKM
jgi:hypothetical protein